MAIDPHPHRHPAGDDYSQQPTPSSFKALHTASMEAGKQSNDDAVAAGGASTSECASSPTFGEHSIIGDARLSLSSRGLDDDAAKPTSSTRAPHAQANVNIVPPYSSRTPRLKQKRKTVSSAKLWTKHEEDVIRAGVARYGTSWKRVSPYFATEAPQNHRTVTALSQHYHLFLKGGGTESTSHRQSQAEAETAGCSAAAPAQGSRSSTSFSSSSSVLPPSCVAERTTTPARLRVELDKGQTGERQAEGMHEEDRANGMVQEGSEDFEEVAQELLIVGREGNEEACKREQASNQDSAPQRVAHNPSQSSQDAPQSGAEDHIHLAPSPSRLIVQFPPSATTSAQLTDFNHPPTLAQASLDYSVLTLDYGFRFERLPLGCELSIFSPTHYRLRSLVAAHAGLGEGSAAAAAFTFHILAEGSVVGVKLPPGTKTHATVVLVDEGAKVGGWMIETHFDAECGFKVVFAMPL